MIIEASSRLNSVKTYYFARKLAEIAELRKSGKNILNLGIGSPDLMPPNDVIESVCEYSQGENVHGYQSYTGIPEIKHAFSLWMKKWFSVDIDEKKEILPLIGSKEGIMHISMSFLEEGYSVLVPNPGYPSYRSASLLAGANVIEYKLHENFNWQADLDELESIDLSTVKLMWLNYPNMPTGADSDLRYFNKLIKFAERHKILLCHDNPYAFILNEEPKSIFQVEGSKQVAIELCSLSKSYNMAGWRIGALIANEEIIKTVLKFKSNMDSGMFKPIQIAACKALEQNADWFSKINEVYKKRRAKVFEIFDLLGCVYDKEQVGMFVWAKVPDKYKDAEILSNELLYDQSVFVTPGKIFGTQGEGYLRISLCNTLEIFDEAINRIKQRES